MSVYSDAVLADSPLLYWRLGEASGTTADDATANNRDGTYVGSPTLAASGALVDGGDSDTAITLSGTGQWITSTYALTQGSSYTFECWAKRTDQAAQHTLYATDGSGAPMLARMTAGDQLDFYSQAGSNVSWASSGIGTGTWKHVVVRFDNAGDLASLFVNGAQVGTAQSLSADFQATPGNFLMGAWSDLHFEPWKGGLDEVAVYPGALSDARILAHYQAEFITGSTYTMNTVTRSGRVLT